MNRIKVLAGLVATAALFSISSCITIDHTLGLSFIPTDQYFSVDIVDIDLPVHQVMADSIQTSATSSTTFGAIQTTTYGKMYAMGVFSITPNTDSLIIGDNPVFKKMYATLALDDTQQLSDDQKKIPQNIYLYQLNKELDSTMIYSCSITKKDLKPTPISKENSIYVADDETDIVLTEEFAKPFFDLTFEEIDSAELFMKKFYGIAIMTDETPDGFYGGRLNSLDLASSTAYLTYESTNWEGRRRDTTIQFQLGAYYSLSSFTCGSREIAEKDQVDSIIHMEGIAGVKPVIYGNELKKAITDWAESVGIEDLNKLVVTRASLIFPFEYTGTPSDYDNHPVNLFPNYRLADSTTVVYSPIDEINDDGSSHGETNMSLFEFRSDASYFIQDLLRKETFTFSDDLWMMPTMTSTGSDGTTTVNLTDFFYYSLCTMNGTACERHPKLRLTFTVIK